jgi:pantothenate kinase-related protein Tda10
MIMKKTFKKEEHTGYEIGIHILIHSNINNPEGWFLTIRPLQIFSESLCEKTCTEAEIARYVNVRLHTNLNIIESLIDDVIHFT